MSDARREVRDAAANQQIFLNEWQTYRKVVDGNYMFHREVYGLLRGIIDREAEKPFRFLDVACGDASASAAALRGADIAHYYGIDLSAAALAIARKSLAGLPCPVTLIEGDFAAVLDRWREPIDVAWIGQSLHHLLPAGKVGAMRAICKALRPGGLFLIWEPTTFEGEDRSGWADRLDESSRELWSALNDAERDAMVSHSRAADYPETSENWQALGREAGFAGAREAYAAPTRLARVYEFRM